MSVSLRVTALVWLFSTLAPVSAQPAMPPAKDDVKLPADAILVVYDKAVDALKAVPKLVMLSPERYKAMQGEIERLNKLLEARQPTAIGIWKLTGKIRGNQADLKVTFTFRTERDKAVVHLGCGRGTIRNVLLDDKLPSMWQGADGLYLEVEKAERHTVVLELLAQVSDQKPSAAPPMPRPSNPPEPYQGFDLDLPLATVTEIDLELPPGLKGLEINDRAPKDVVTVSGTRVNGPLGSIGRLKMAWKVSPTVSGGAAVLSSTGRIVTRLQGNQVITDAELTLRDFGRTAKDFRLQVPAGAQVRLANAEDRVRLRGDIQGSESADGRVTIPLAAPSGDPLAVTVSLRQPHGGALLLGPFQLLDATEQRGALFILGEPDLRPRASAHQPGRPGFVIAPRNFKERGMSVPASTVGAFDYQALLRERGSERDPWFKVELESVSGMLDLNLDLNLKLGSGGAHDWRLATTFDAIPLRAEVDRMELEWPAPWQFDAARGLRPAGLAKFQEDPARRQVNILFDAVTLQPFRLSLEALPTAGESRAPFASVPDYAFSSVILPLPRPKESRDRGGHTIVIQAPPTHDLRVRQPPNPNMELVSEEAHRLVYKASNFVSQIAVGWKPYEARVRVESLLHLSITADLIDVEQRLDYEFADRLDGNAAEVLLRVPAEILGLRVVEGGSLDDISAASRPRGKTTDRIARCSVNAPPGETRKPYLKLRYQARLPKGFLPSATQPLEAVLPLVKPEGTSQGTSRVRLWLETGVRVQTMEPEWHKERLDFVEDRERLPSAVWTSLSPVQSLSLRQVVDRNNQELPPIIVDRVLIHVRVDEGGVQHYRCRFLVRQANADHVDLLMPAPHSALNLLVFLEGKSLEITPLEGGAEGMEIRLALPRKLPRVPAALEATYKLSTTSGGLLGSFESGLLPVLIRGMSPDMDVRWQVSFPPERVPLPLDANSVWRWGIRGWLLAPQSVGTATDQERWFWGAGDPRGNQLAESDAAEVPSFVGRMDELRPLTIYHVPQQSWLLACSLLVLVLGLLVIHVWLAGSKREQRRRTMFWFLIALFAAGIAGLGLFAPGLLMVGLYGAQPGLAVLLLVLLFQWLMQERYRRRVVFLPGFRRVKAGSSLTRASRAEAATSSVRGDEAPPLVNQPQGRSSATRKPKEPSTVDAPSPQPS